MLYSASPAWAQGLSVWDWTALRRRGMWCRRVEPALCFLTDSSKELEELRSAFARALEYLKQEVEERKCVLLPCPPVLPRLVLGSLQAKAVCLSAILFAFNVCLCRILVATCCVVRCVESITDSSCGPRA